MDGKGGPPYVPIDEHDDSKPPPYTSVAVDDNAPTNDSNNEDENTTIVVSRVTGKVQFIPGNLKDNSNNTWEINKCC
jgi:predicted transcriptional regulator